MNNKKAQGIGALLTTVFGALFLILILSQVMPPITESIKSVSCQNEKNQITGLQTELQNCKIQLNTCITTAQESSSSLEVCRGLLNSCENKLENCTGSYEELYNMYLLKDQPVNQYFFIKMFSDKIILFDWLIIYNIQAFGLFLSLGISFTIKFFEINIHIRVLNRKNQKKLVRDIRRYLIEHPYVPVWIMIGFILLTNLF